MQTSQTFNQKLVQTTFNPSDLNNILTNNLLNKKIFARLNGNKVSTFDASNKEAKIKFTKWRINRRVRNGGFIGHTVSQYCSFLNRLASENKYAAHDHVLSAGLAYVAFLPEAAIENFLRQMLSFIQTAKVLAGLESIFLSCMASVQNSGSKALFAEAANTWMKFGPSSNKIRQNTGYLFFYDRSLNILTAVNANKLNGLYAAIFSDRFRDASLASFIRNLGTSTNTPTNGNIVLPLGEADDNEGCKDKANTIVQIGGFVLGLGVGAGLSTMGTSTADKIGITTGVTGGGAALGQGLALIIASAACKDSSSGSKNSDVVAGLVSAVKAGVLTVDQALDAASKLGGEPTAPEQTQTIDQILDSSSDPYYGVSPVDLLDGSGEGTPMTNSTEKPDDIDDEDWDLINSITQPDSSMGGSDSMDGTPVPASPEGFPDPDSDTGGNGTTFGFGPIGPWIAGFGSQQNGSPFGNQTNNMPTIDGGGPTNPFALPNGSYFIPAPNVFGIGAIVTSGIIKSVALEGNNGKTSSCAIIAMPRINSDGTVIAGFLQQKGLSGI